MNENREKLNTDSENRMKFLTNDFVENIFQKNYNNMNIKIKNIQKGNVEEDYFASMPIRVRIYYTDDTNSLQEEKIIIKLFPNLPEEEKKKFLFLFRHENNFYSTIWPQYEHYLPDLKQHPFVPKYYYGCPSNVVALKDLTQIGYKNANRINRLDLSHCKITLKTLARFHALSIKLKENHKFPRKIPEEIRKDRFFDNVYHVALQVVADQVVHWKGYEHYESKLRKLSKTASERMKYLLFSGTSQLEVINHGDLWLENILFHYPENSSNPDSVCFIDYQFWKAGSPAQDLLFFLYSSAQIDIVINDFNLLMDYYLNEVHLTLTQMQVSTNLFPRNALLADLEEAYLFGVLTACIVQVVTQLPYGQPMPFLSLIDGTALRDKSQWRGLVNDNPSVREFIQKVLDQANQRGFFH